jgi:hypothetical protein
VTVPPAASIFSAADFENECAVTESFFVSLPSPRIFTSTESFAMRPAALSASGVTSAPESNRRSRLATFTGCEYVRKGPMGIASADVLPRSFPTRMSIGI